MHYNDQGADFKYLLSMNVTSVSACRWLPSDSRPSGPGAFIHHATTRTLIISRPRKDVCCMNISWYTLLKDGGTFASDTTPSVDISKGQILFLFPGQWHTYAPLQKTGWNEYYIGFEGPIIDNLVKTALFQKKTRFWISVSMKNWPVFLPVHWK